MKLFRYLYAHPYLYLVWQNFSHCWMNCLVVWLEHFNNSEIHFISQVISDVFGAPVFVSDIPNSAALGSCYRAKHGVYQRILWVLYWSICMSYKFLSWQIPNAFELIHLYNFWEKREKVIYQSEKLSQVSQSRCTLNNTVLIENKCLQTGMVSYQEKKNNF